MCVIVARAVRAKRLAAVFLALTLRLPLGASEPGIAFSHLTVDDGLSNNFVGTLCQDARGNIWLGTNDGVNFYNGYDIVVFRHDPNDPDSLPSNIINYLYDDGAGRIWACTANGLAWFDNRTGAFRRVRLEGIHSVEVIARISGDLYLFSTRNDAYYFDFLTGETTRCRIDGANLRCYAIDARDGVFLVGTMEKTVELLRFEDGVLKRKRSPVSTACSTSTCEAGR